MKKPAKPARRKDQPAAAIPGQTPSPQAPEQVETLQHERNLLRAILDNLPSIIFFKDKDGRYVLTNRAHQRVLGATEGAILGKTAFDFHPHDLTRQYLEDEMQIMRTGEPLPAKEELALNRETGAHRWHLTSRIPFKDESGRVVGVFGISHDITERKRAEQALQMFQYSIDQASHAVFWMNRDGRFSYVNDQACRSLGYTREELLRLHLWDIDPVFPKELWFSRWEGYQNDRRGGEEHLESLHRRKDGTDFPVEVTSKHIWFGDFELHVAYVRDITKRKQAEEALRASQMLYHSFVEQLPAAVFRKDGEGRYVMVNSQFCRVKGMKAKDFLGKKPLEVAAGKPAKRDQSGQAIKYAGPGEEIHEQIMRTGKPVETDEEYSGADGRKEFLHVVRMPVFGPDGKVVGTQGIQFDITERKRAEETLRESRQLLQAVVEGTSDAVYLKDLNGRYLLFNGAASRYVGKTSDEVIGQDDTFIFPLNEAREVMEGDRKVMVGGKITTCEEHVTTADGKKRIFYSIKGPMFDSNGNVIGLFGVARDITERKQADEALRQSEAMLKQSQHVARLGHYKLDAVSGDWTSSETLDDVFGIDAAFKKNVAGWSKLIHPEDRKAMLAYLQDHVLKGGGPFNKEYRIVRANDGGIRWVHGLGELRFNAAGKVMEMFGIIQDITERRKAEEALQQFNVLLRTIIETAPTPIIGLDLDGKVQSVWNRAAEKMLGWSAQEAMGRHLPSVPTENAEEFERFRNQMRDGKTLDGVEVRRQKRDGTPIDYSIYASPLHDPEGKIFGNIAVLMDITERKRAEERIREQAALLDAANDAIYVCTLDHTVIYWNDGAERLYGWTRAEALGRKSTGLTEVDVAAFEAAHATLLQQGSWSGELKKTSKAGKEFTIFCRWTLLRDESGRPKEILAINTDITERKQLEANFLRAQRMEGIGALAGGIAHDLNNILQPILMTAPLLRETTGDPEIREMLDTVENCAQRGADIIKQLLTFARGEPGARVPLPVRHFMGEMKKLIQETFPRNIQLRVNVPENLWQVLGDATQIHQALMNLCVNARDAMANGGTLTLAAENLTLDEAFAAMMSGAKPGPYICMSVADTGTGIPPENLDRIFDPFFTTKEIGKGTGLGLATVLGIARGHGGLVRVNSQVGKGTTFELYLPASPEAKAAARSERETLPPRAGGELILVVDDEASVRGVVRRTLENHGYQVATAAEGAEAVALFARHRAEVRAVLTDMMMPGMDGPSLVRALEQLEPQLPILGMTGVGEKADIKGLETLDLVVLLTKPFSGAGLLGVLHQALAAPRKAGGKP